MIDISNSKFIEKYREEMVDSMMKMNPSWDKHKVEKEIDNARITEKSSDSLKDEVKKKEKKSKLKKEKKLEKPKPQTLDTSALLKKKNDRNGI